MLVEVYEKLPATMKINLTDFGFLPRAKNVLAELAMPCRGYLLSSRRGTRHFMAYVQPNDWLLAAVAVMANVRVQLPAGCAKLALEAKRGPIDKKKETYSLAALPLMPISTTAESSISKNTIA